MKSWFISLSGLSVSQARLLLQSGMGLPGVGRP